jgi:hypothetical protein
MGHDCLLAFYGLAAPAGRDGHCGGGEAVESEETIMPHTPQRKAAERPVKTSTIDRRDQKKQERLLARPVVKNSQIHKLDQVGIKKG